jgi:RimJ/RimL family protein N-acetyltransferase
MPEFMIFTEEVDLAVSSENDAERLCQLQRAAFDAESERFHRSRPFGPEGYDIIYGLVDLMRRTELHRIMHRGSTVGGLAVTVSGSIGRLVRIFVDPSHQGMGIGRTALLQLMDRCPNVSKWELGTPDWSSRNHRFYESLGFRKVGETDQGDRGFRLFLYEKINGQV